jgi:hypothetical protein
MSRGVMNTCGSRFTMENIPSIILWMPTDRSWYLTLRYDCYRCRRIGTLCTGITDTCISRSNLNSTFIEGNLREWISAKQTICNDRSKDRCRLFHAPPAKANPRAPSLRGSQKEGLGSSPGWSTENFGMDRRLRPRKVAFSVLQPWKPNRVPCMPFAGSGWYM